jgi:serine/threonine protein kinase
MEALVATALADLSNPLAVKRGVFALKDQLLDPAFSKEFRRVGGLSVLSSLVSTTSGNTLAYTLEAMRFAYREADSASKQLPRSVVLALVSHMRSDAPTNVVKSAIETCILVNNHDRELVLSVAQELAEARRDAPLASIARLMSNADIDVQRKAFTMLNAILSGAAPRSREQLLRGLETASVHRILLPLRHSQDVLVRAQMCAFQVGRLDDVRRRKETRYDTGNEDHEKKLRQLWDLTFPDEPLPAREGKHWGRLGFQGQDPSTDFRGMGILGLEALLYMAESHTNTWRETVARNEARGEREFPLAVAGINSCKLIDDTFGLATTIQGGESTLLHPLLLDSARPFEELHYACFRILDRLWDDMNSDYMKFGPTLEATRLAFVVAVGHYTTFAEWHRDLDKGITTPTGTASTVASSKSGRKAGGKLPSFIKYQMSTASSDTQPIDDGALRQRQANNAEITRLHAEIASLQERLADAAMAPLATASSPRGASNASPQARPGSRGGSRGGSSVGGRVGLQSSLDRGSGAAVSPRTDTSGASRASTPRRALDGSLVFAIPEVARAAFVLDRDDDWTRTQVTPTSWGVFNVAIKRRDDTEADAAAAEAECLARCRSPDIVSLLAVAGDASDRWLVLELCPLGALRPAISRLSTAARLRAATSLALAVCYLHTRLSPALVHGDITSDHALLVSTDGAAKLCSLSGVGASDVLSTGGPIPADDAELEAYAGAVTTWNVDVRYAAPERFSAPSSGATTHSDIYSLACVLWELLTAGGVPWAGTAVHTVIARVRGGDRLPLPAPTDDAASAGSADAPAAAATLAPPSDASSPRRHHRPLAVLDNVVRDVFSAQEPSQRLTAQECVTQLASAPPTDTP